MPTYQYVCTECATPLEAVQSFSDPALSQCPSCPGALRKVFSAVGVVFKGSGFYKTDSRSNGKSSSAPAASSDSGASSSSSDSTTSAAPASSDSGSGKSSGTSDSKPAAPAKAASTAS